LFIPPFSLLSVTCYLLFSTVTRNEITISQSSPHPGFLGWLYFFPLTTALSTTPPNVGFSPIALHTAAA
jgi:hypothetical protein